MESKFDTEFIDDEIEDQPYRDNFARESLHEWFAINDSVEPIFESRKNWEKREAMLEKNLNDNGYRLHLPKDLNLFEMIDVVSAVDKETFRNNPELSTQGVEKIERLADTFKKVGVYINDNLASVSEGKEIAEELSKKFFNYGLSLQTKTKKNTESIEPTTLSESEKRELDKWLIGKERYYIVMSRLGPNPTQEDIEEERKKHFRGYFKALSLNGSKGEGEKPWERSLGPIAKIQEKTEGGIRSQLSEPDTEIYRAGFRRGREKLKAEMKVPLTSLEKLKIYRKAYRYIMGKDLMTERRILFEELSIPKLREELSRTKSSGDIEKISQKELEIAKRIKAKILEYEYHEDENNPSKVVKNNYINCLGSTLLGSSLLDEVGIKYLYVSPPGHAMTFLLTSENKLYYQDFTPSGNLNNDMEMTDDMFEGEPNILTLAKNSDCFNVFLKKDHKNYRISNSVDAMMSSLALNLASTLHELGKDGEAVEVFQRSLKLNPNDFGLFNNLGNSLNSMGRNKEAVEVYQRGIRLNPNHFALYNGLGNVLGDIGRYEEAVEAYNKGLELNPSNSVLQENLRKTLEDLARKEQIYHFR